MRALPAALLLLLPAAEACSGGPAVVLVRHAEKGPGRDPDLTGEGRRRALALVDVVRPWGASAVLHTQFRRSVQTAEPLSTHLNLPRVKVEYTPGQEDAHAEEILRILREKFAGQTVIIVGHTSTLPVIMRKLGVETSREIPETEFGTIFFVSGATVSEIPYGE